jgi:hypothetical protein
LKLLYLHMGFPKTATSSIQMFLNTNKKILLQDKGVLYPDAGKINEYSINHFRGYFCFMEKEHFLCPKNIREPKEEWGDILREGLEYDANLLLSCEAFINLSIKHIELIMDIIDHEYILKPIIYIRRLDEYINSWYNQIVKEENWTSTDIRFDYYLKNLREKFSKIKDIALLVGKENMIIRGYENDQLYNDNIYDDFFVHVFSNTITKKYELPSEHINHSLSKKTLEYKTNCKFIYYH